MNNEITGQYCCGDQYCRTSTLPFYTLIGNRPPLIFTRGGEISKKFHRHFGLNACAYFYRSTEYSSEHSLCVHRAAFVCLMFMFCIKHSAQCTVVFIHFNFSTLNQRKKQRE